MTMQEITDKTSVLVMLTDRIKMKEDEISWMREIPKEKNWIFYTNTEKADWLKDWNIKIAAAEIELQKLKIRYIKNLRSN